MSKLIGLRKSDSAKLSSLKTESEEWLTSEEVAAYLKISKKTLMNLVSLGKVPRSKFGRLNRYRKSEIYELVLPSKGGK